VEVPVGATGNPVKAVVYKVRSFVNAESPVRAKDARTVCRIVQAGSEDPAYSGKNDNSAKNSAPKIENFPRAVGKKKKRHGLRTVLVLAAVAAIVYGGIAYKQYDDRQKELAAIAYAEESYLRARDEFAAGHYTKARKAFYEAWLKDIDDSYAWYYLSCGMEYASGNSYSSAKRDIQKAADLAETDEVKKLAESLLLKVKKQEELYEAELARQREEVKEKPVSSEPYVGMTLSPEKLEYRGTDKVNGMNVTKYRYIYGSKQYDVYLDKFNSVRKVVDVTPNYSGGTSQKKNSNKRSGSEYPASDYVHPDDFYYDYYDDFYDYEDAEDYWEEYG